MIGWITERLGTCAWEELPPDGVRVLDVRDLVDKRGNAPHVVKPKIEEALAYLRRGERVVVSCDYGISRSNAIAAGILAAYEGIALNEAVRRVVAATGESSIKLEVLSAVRLALQPDVTNQSAPQKILITGGTGIVGSALAQVWRAKPDFLAPTRQEIDLTRDVVKLDLHVKERGVQTIVHLAHPRVYTTNESLGAALVMLKNVLDVCAENNLSLVWLSHWEIYSGYRAQMLRADETLAANPRGAFGLTKCLGEMLLNRYNESHGVRSTLLRSASVYGAASPRPKFLWNFIDKARRGEEIVAHKYLNGYPALDLLHVSDLASAIARIVERGACGAFNLGSGTTLTTTEIAERIVARLKSPSRIRHIDIKEYASNIVMDYSRAAQALGWQPDIALDQGLGELIECARRREQAAPSA